MGGIEGYRPSKQNAKLHRQRNEPEITEVELPKAKGEAEGVPGYQLSPLLRKWIVNFLKDHPIGGRNDHEGPVNWLSEHTGINVKRVSQISNGKVIVVPLTEADSLLIAIGQQHLLSTGEIQVVPNPTWSLETWMAYMQDRGCV